MDEFQERFRNEDDEHFEDLISHLGDVKNRHGRRSKYWFEGGRFHWFCFSSTHLALVLTKIVQDLIAEAYVDYCSYKQSSKK